MSLSVTVMAHRKREHFVRELVPQLPGCEVVWDRRDDRWDTGRRALLEHVETGSEWSLVVQDDAILCRDFIAGCERALSYVRGERPVAFYLGRVRPNQAVVRRALKRAQAQGETWLEMEGPWWGVAIAVPTEHIPRLVAWGDKRRDIPNYDKRIARYYAHLSTPCWYSLPCLVDHRRVAENPSLIEGRTGDRYAHEFIGQTESALSVRWKSTAVGPHGRPPREQARYLALPAFEHKRSGRVVRPKQGTHLAASLARSQDWQPVEA